MCNDEDELIRRTALINLELNEVTFPLILNRIRDKDTEIRSSAFRKLTKERILIHNLKLCEIYKIVYDGMTQRDQKVKMACTTYL